MRCERCGKEIENNDFQWTGNGKASHFKCG